MKGQRGASTPLRIEVDDPKGQIKPEDAERERERDKGIDLNVFLP